MKKRIILAVALILSGVMLSAAALQTQQQRFSGKLIRLHVVANSDSEADQARKLQVRDAVLQVTRTLDAGTLPQALPEIRRAAEQCLQAQGCTDPVTVSLGQEHFPTRMYENFSLPAGVYTALRITIGAGEGQNWWCVAFPSICFRATAAELEEAAVSAGFSSSEVRLITEDGGYVLKFKLLELLDQLKQRLFA